MNELMSNGYTKVDPGLESLGVYWVAVNGQCMAVVPPNPGQSAICSVERDMCALFGARGYGWNDIYVIWQPKSHTAGVWNRWQSKWSKRTAQSVEA